MDQSLEIKNEPKIMRRRESKTGHSKRTEKNRAFDDRRPCEKNSSD